ncbi:MAG: double zinc ribbon domain-containing protein [Rhizomicrobium sp.]
MGSHWKTLLADILFPPLCIACRAPLGGASGFCAGCWSQIAFLDGPMCDGCGLPFVVDAGEGTRCGACLARPPAYDRARAIFAYDSFSRGPILALKHADRLELVPGFAQWLERAGRLLISESEIIIPVPLHRLRLWRRRYNQAAELARALGRRTGKPVLLNTLVRKRKTESQGAMVSASGRRRNVRGAFAVPRPAMVKGRSILLIDDVLTTGATAESCARALKGAGAATVHVLALARVVKGAEASPWNIPGKV